MGKTRDLFKKIRDNKATFHAKMSTIKDRNGRDLTKAEDIRKGVRGRSTLRAPICCIFLCVPFLMNSLFLISSWNTGTSGAACSSHD